MKNLLRCILCFALVLGMATPSEAFICCLINKIVECPPIRKKRNECRAKKAAHKMKPKKHLLACLKKALDHGCFCELECDCQCESPCD